MSDIVKAMLAVGNTTSCSTAGIHAALEPHLWRSVISVHNCIAVVNWSHVWFMVVLCTDNTYGVACVHISLDLLSET